MKEINNYDWGKVSTFSVKEQKAILRASSPKKRKTLWQNKVNHILTISLSKDEREYLEWFADIFKKINYNEPTPEYLSAKMKKKVLEAKSKFGWSDKLIHNLFFTTDDVVLKNKYIDYQFYSRGNTDDGPDDGNNPPDTCDCKYDLGCGWAKECASNSGCEYNNGDCGIFGNDSCNGSCY